MIEKVRETIRRYRLLQKFDRVLVAVSGGPDSLALLYVLINLRKEYNLTLHIAHLDHMLRKDSRRDAEFVEDLARRLKIPITTGKVNIKELAKDSSIEETARNARLGFLSRVAKQVRADRIALGHNLDDQAETVLMRILRGTGISGLSAILPKRNIAGLEFIRPLLEVKRKDITAFLSRKKIRPRIDTSNFEDVYLRNRIRLRLLPMLEKQYNKNIKEVLAHLAESVGCDYNYLQKLAKQKMKGMKTRLALKKLLKLDPAIQRLIIRSAIANVKGDTRRIGFQHIREIEDLLLSRPINSIVDLPKGVSVIKKKSYLSFYCRNR